MRRLILLLGAVLFLSMAAAAQENPVTFAFPAPAAAASPQGGGGSLTDWQLTIGYQFNRIYPLVHGTNTNGLNLSVVRFFGNHFGLEGNVGAGFGNTSTFTIPNSTPCAPGCVKTVFAGVGAHVSFVRDRRLEPWAHALVGLEHFRFTQTSTLGTLNSFAYLAGAGLDWNFSPRAAIRGQIDYLGTNILAARQGNLQIVGGLVLNF